MYNNRTNTVSSAPSLSALMGTAVPMNVINDINHSLGGGRSYFGTVNDRYVDNHNYFMKNIIIPIRKTNDAIVKLKKISAQPLDERLQEIIRIDNMEQLDGNLSERIKDVILQHPKVKELKLNGSIYGWDNIYLDKYKNKYIDFTEDIDRGSNSIGQYDNITGKMEFSFYTKSTWYDNPIEELHEVINYDYYGDIINGTSPVGVYNEEDGTMEFGYDWNSSWEDLDLETIDDISTTRETIDKVLYETDLDPTDISSQRG